MELKPENTPGEFSLRDLILKVREYIHEVFSYWKIPMVCALLLAGYMVWKYYKFVPVYTATITFNVDEDEGGSSSGLTGLLGQFGIAGGKPTRFNLDKILALSKSRRVIQQSLFGKKIIVAGKEDFIANHLIREYKLNGGEQPGNKKAPFFFTHDSLDIFTTEENSVLLQLYGFIIGPSDNPKYALMKADYSDDTNIMSLSVTTTNETISLELANRMFESLSKYYIDKSIEKLLKTYTLVSDKRDSVLAVLKSAEYSLASFRDSHRSVLMRTDQITELRLQREIAATTAMYGEVLKNTEVADFSLKNKTPFVQVIDTPMAPLQPAQMSLLLQIIKGLLLGGVLGCIIVIGRKVIRSALSPS